jgi:hypothetical protein
MGLMSTSWRRPTFVLAMLAGLVLPCRAQELALPGRLIERDSVRGDTTQHLAVYIPSHYDRGKPAPVLFVLDPRGRGLLGLRLFAGAAERHGWIVLSSYNSLSDAGTNAPNVAAMNAMLAWGQTHVSMDTTRIYIAGFSGTSRAEWRFAAELRPMIAGMFGASGAVSMSASGPEAIYSGDSTFAFFGAAGTTDFNYDEMRGFATRLRLARIPSRMDWFHGPHSWPPRALCERGLEWLEMRAMLGGRRPMDTAFVAASFRRDLQRADSLERAGQLDAAETLFREVSIDARNRPEGPQAIARADALLDRPALRDLRKQARALAERNDEDARRMQQVLVQARSGRPMEPEKLLDELDVPALKRRAASADSLDADAAARQLSRVIAFLAFYEPRGFLESGQPERAASALRAASTLVPIVGESCQFVQLTAQKVSPEDAGRLPACAPTSPPPRTP